MSSEYHKAFSTLGADAREIHLREPGPGENMPPPGPDLPSAYGQDRLLLLARDPHTLFATWELTGGMRERVLEQTGFPPDVAQLTLRLLAGRGEPQAGAHGTIIAEHRVEGNHAWYLHGAPSGSIVHAQLGLKVGELFVPIVTSAPVPLPRGHESDVVHADWVTIEEVLERSRRGLHAASSPTNMPSGGIH